MRFFNRVSLSTPESVEIELTLAGIGSRTLALVIDYQILGLALIAFWALWLIIVFGVLGYFEEARLDYSQAPIWLLAIAILANFVIYNGYFVYFETMRQGQTPGKRFTKIRVVRDDGRPVGLTQAVLRSLLRTIDDFLFIGMLFILFGKREKRIGDWAAGTIVIQVDQTETTGSKSWLSRRSSRTQPQDDFTISDSARQLAQQLPELADLSQLLPDDFAVIREYLRRRSTLDLYARSKKAMQLADQLRSLIRLNAIPSGVSSDEFLEAIYLAYQHQTGLS